MPKSKNEFAQPDLEWTIGLASWNRKFEKLKFAREVEDLGRFRALNRPGVLAGANFIALRRTVSYYYVTRRAIGASSIL